VTAAFSRVLLTTLARSDINAVAEIDVRTAVVSALVEIENDLDFGRLLESRGYTGDLRGCRRVYVDRPDWQGKPRFRLVCWCSPDERQPRTARILAFGPRASSAAYRTTVDRYNADRASAGQSPVENRSDKELGL
jgi:hypothetical protein